MAFLAAGDEIEHNDFVTQAWVDDPLKLLLRRIAGFSRGAGVPTGSTPKKK